MTRCDCGCEIGECPTSTQVGADGLRKWTIRQATLGRISKEVREQLEQCADDMEAGDA